MARRIKGVTIVITSDYSVPPEVFSRTVVQYVVDDSAAPGLEKKASLADMDVAIGTPQLEDELRVFLAGVKAQCESEEGL